MHHYDDASKTACTGSLSPEMERVAPVHAFQQREDKCKHVMTCSASFVGNQMKVAYILGLILYLLGLQWFLIVLMSYTPHFEVEPKELPVLLGKQTKTNTKMTNEDAPGVESSSNTTTLYQQSEMVRGDHHWWIEKRSIKYFRREWKKTIEKYTASDESDLDLAHGWGFPALIEMEDAKHREPGCLLTYHERWQHEDPFSGEPFFDWLDYGSGRNLATKDCSRDVLNRRSYYMMNDTEIEHTIVSFSVSGVDPHMSSSRGQHSHHHNRNLKRNLKNGTTAVYVSFASTGKKVPQGSYLSVWDLEEKLHLFTEDHIYTHSNPSIVYYKQGHASVSHGKPIKYAGEVEVDHGGRLLWTFPESGHYRTRLFHNQRFSRWLHHVEGVPFSALEWYNRDSRHAKPLNEREWEALVVAVPTN